MMRKLLFTVIVVLAACPVQAAKTDVGQLTLDEKIGQMMQLVTDIFGPNANQMRCATNTARRTWCYAKV